MFLTQCLHRGIAHHPDRIATVYGERRRTYRQFFDRVARVGGALRQLGVKPSDRVCVLALNSDRYLECYMGVLWAGAIVNPANTRWSRAEIVYSLNDCEPSVLIVDDNFRSMVHGAQTEAKSVQHIIYIGEDEAPPTGMLAYEGLLSEAEPVPDAFLGNAEPAAIFYTGGTTGYPKGVLLSHTNLLAAAFSRLALGYVPGNAYLHTSGLFHLTGALGVMWQFLSGGTHIILPGFDAEKVMASIEKEKVTDTLLVPTMIQMIVQHPRLGQYDLSSLSTLVYGGSPIAETLLDAAMRAFPRVSFIQGYGMTELAGAICFLPPYYHTTEGRKERKLGSAGRASVLSEIKIVDPQGREEPRGVVGEIAVRSASTMVGYWGKPDETAAVLRDGWMHSGDGAYMDEEGFIFIVDRIKDMIVSGGENVYSAEVENAISKHPGVATCAVVGIPSRQWGESVHAVIVPKPNVEISTEELIAHCKGLIAGYKCPRSVEFRAALPLSGAGKVQKGLIRAPFWEGHSRNVS